MSRFTSSSPSALDLECMKLNEELQSARSFLSGVSGSNSLDPHTNRDNLSQIAVKLHDSQQQLAEQQKDKALMETKLKLMADKFRQIQKELKNNLEQIKNEREIFQQEHSKERTHTENLRLELKELTLKCNRLEEELSEKTTTIANLNNTIANTAAVVSEASCDIPAPVKHASTQSECNTSPNKIINNDNIINKLTSDLLEVTSERDKIKQELSHLSSEINSQKQQINQLTLEKRFQQDLIEQQKQNNLEKQLIAQQNSPRDTYKVQNSHDVNKNNEEKIRSLRINYRRVLQTVIQEVRAVRYLHLQQESQIKRQLDDFQRTTVDTGITLMRRLDKSHSTLLHAANNIKARLEAQLEEVHKSEGQITYLNNKVDHLTIELKTQSEEFDKEMSSEKDQVKENFDFQINNIIMEYNAKIEQLNKDNKSQLDNFNRESNSKIEQLDGNNKSEIEQLNGNHFNQIEQLTKDLENSQKQHSKDNEEANTIIDERNVEIDKLSEELTQLKLHISSTNHSLEQCTGQNSELSSHKDHILTTLVCIVGQIVQSYADGSPKWFRQPPEDQSVARYQDWATSMVQLALSDIQEIVFNNHNESDRLSASVKRAEDKIRSQKETINKGGQKKIQLEQEIQQLQDEITSLVQEKQSLEFSKNATQSDNKYLKQRVEELENARQQHTSQPQPQCQSPVAPLSQEFNPLERQLLQQLLIQQQHSNQLTSSLHTYSPFPIAMHNHQFQSPITNNTTNNENYWVELERAKAQLIVAQEQLDMEREKLNSEVSTSSQLQKRIAKYERDIANLRNTCDQYATDYKNVSADCSQINTQLTVTNNSMKMIQDENSKLCAKLENLEKINFELNEKNNEIERLRSNLTEELKITREELEINKNNLNDTKKNLDDSLDHKWRLDGDLIRANQQLLEVTNQLSAQNQALQEAKTHRASLSAQLNKMASQNALLLNEKTKLLERIINLEGNIKFEAERDINSHNRDAQQQTSFERIDKYSNTSLDMQIVNNEDESRKKKNESNEISALKTQIAELRFELETKQTRIDKLSEKFSEVQKSFQKEYEMRKDKQKKLTELEIEYKSIKTQLDEIYTQASHKLTTQEKELKGQIDKLRSQHRIEILELKTQFDKNVANWMEKYEHAKELLKTANNEIFKQNDDITNISVKYNENEKELLKSQNQLLITQHKNKNLNAKIDEISLKNCSLFSISTQTIWSEENLLINELKSQKEDLLQNIVALEENITSNAKTISQYDNDFKLILIFANTLIEELNANFDATDKNEIYKLQEDENFIHRIESPQLSPILDNFIKLKSQITFLISKYRQCIEIYNKTKTSQELILSGQDDLIKTVEELRARLKEYTDREQCDVAVQLSPQITEMLVRQQSKKTITGLRGENKKLISMLENEKTNYQELEISYKEAIKSKDATIQELKTACTTIKIEARKLESERELNKINIDEYKSTNQKLNMHIEKMSQNDSQFRAIVSLIPGINNDIINKDINELVVICKEALLRNAINSKKAAEEYQNLKLEYERLTAQLATSEQLIDISQGEKRNEESKCSNINVEFSFLKEEFDRQASEISSLKKHNQTLQTVKGTFDNMLKGQKDVFTKLNTSVGELQAEREKLHSQLSKLKAENENIKSDYENFEKNATAKSINHAKTDKMNELSAKRWKALEKDYKKKIKELSTELFLIKSHNEANNKIQHNTNHIACSDPSVLDSKPISDQLVGICDNFTPHKTSTPIIQRKNSS